ncbi:hypothetical protein QR680_012941 [Steinernema hermaphroditum]|uniref:Uncharacterized protein n=1 Tax=Steinernema hermaphroditum TaxID=289476 RepID=A0AA39I592_9BILA|nr:hypothetical protein QR680_012941 [Steinernema hermaphroditum]
MTADASEKSPRWVPSPSGFGSLLPKVIVVDCAGTSFEALGLKDSWLPPNTRLQTKPQPFVERLSAADLAMSLRIPRSRSVDLGFLGQEKYLSRWSRENTPIDSAERYERNVRRSYTPVREVGAYKVIDDHRRPFSTYRARTPIGGVTAPYHTNINYYSESAPIRKYDVFQLRTWSYPIYKYIYGRDTHSSRPYSYTSHASACYGTTPKYTPPTIRADCHPMTTRRGYSGYSYLADERSFDIASRPYSLSTSHTKFWRSHVPSAPYYSYSGSSSLRHYNSYRPRTYSSRISLYWAPYF